MGSVVLTSRVASRQASRRLTSGTDPAYGADPMQKLGSLVLGTFVALVWSGGAARALNQAKHQELSHDGCTGHGLPDRFCRQVGVEAYNVDHYEWDDPSAHA